MKKLLFGLTLLASMSSFAGGMCEMESVSYEIENNFDKTLDFKANAVAVESYEKCVSVALTEIAMSNHYRNVNSKTLFFSYLEGGARTLGTLTK